MPDTEVPALFWGTLTESVGVEGFERNCCRVAVCGVFGKGAAVASMKYTHIRVYNNFHLVKHINNGTCNINPQSELIPQITNCRL